MSLPTVRVLVDAQGVAEAAADQIIEAATAAVAARGVFHLCTTGGSTPAALYRALREPSRADRMPWAQTQIWFGDDRFFFLLMALRMKSPPLHQRANWRSSARHRRLSCGTPPSCARSNSARQASFSAALQGIPPESVDHGGNDASWRCSLIRYAEMLLLHIICINTRSCSIGGTLWVTRNEEECVTNCEAAMAFLKKSTVTCCCVCVAP